ncbi:hypothetical protein HDU76_006736 [Blyttiomyces sp. JEL0837]|nr:hypothetical protein HDU76_006736 [Blyttiomyces sp. JEL0837]
MNMNKRKLELEHDQMIDWQIESDDKRAGDNPDYAKMMTARRSFVSILQLQAGLVAQMELAASQRDATASDKAMLNGYKRDLLMKQRMKERVFVVSDRREAMMLISAWIQAPFIDAPA